MNQTVSVSSLLYTPTSFMLGSRPFSEKILAVASSELPSWEPCLFHTGRKRRSPVSCSASDHDSIDTMSAGIHSTQGSVFAEGGEDPENNKWVNNFPLSVLWQGVLNRSILGILELFSYQKSFHFTSSRPWILPAHRERNPVWSHPTTVAVPLPGCMNSHNVLIHSRNSYWVAALGQALCQVLGIKYWTRGRTCPHEV